MDRSLYPDGVAVHSVDLQRTESDRAQNILTRQTDLSSRGVVSGLVVSASGTQVNISSGYGYAPNGELVSLSSAVSGLGLSDYTSGVKNYILLVYTETNDDLRPHETNGQSYATAANGSSRITILSATEYDALPKTDSNLNNNSKDRALVLSIITAQGAAVSLIPSSLQQPPTLNGGLTAVNITSSITGVSIVGIDQLTATGSGTLSFVKSTNTLAWVGPGDTSGTLVVVSAGGTFTLPSLPSLTSIVVTVTTALLPSSDKSDTISVSNIYLQAVPRNTGIDLHHRSLIGSGTPTTKNPHGMTPQDLGMSETIVEEHQDLFHSNGILTGSNANALLATVNTTGVPHKLDYVALSAGDRIYLNGFLHTSSDNVVSFADVTNVEPTLYNIYALHGANGVMLFDRVQRVKYDDIIAPNLSSPVQLRNISDNITAGASQIKFVDANNALQFKATGDISFGPQVTVPVSSAVTLRLFSSTSNKYIDVFVDIIGSAKWVGINGIGDITKGLTVLALPSVLELYSRLKLTAAMFSGSATKFLGNGHGANNSPNSIVDHRLFGITSADDIRDDSAVWTQTKAEDGILIAGVVNKRIGIGTQFPNFSLHLISGANDAPRLDRYTDDTSGQAIVFRKARGTLDIPTTIVNGDTVARLIGQAHDGVAFRSVGEINILVNTAVAIDDIGTAITFINRAAGPGGALVERMRIVNSTIAANGRVGINNTNPSFTLHMASTDEAATIFAQAIGASHGTAGFLLQTPGDLPGWYVALDSFTGANFGGVLNRVGFLHSGVKMLIDPTGNGRVGIALNTPITATGPRGELHIGPSIARVQLGDDPVAANNWHLTNDVASAVKALRIYNGNIGAGTSQIAIAQNGYVGFGINAPLARIHVPAGEAILIGGDVDSTNVTTNDGVMCVRLFNVGPAVVKGNIVIGTVEGIAPFRAGFTSTTTVNATGVLGVAYESIANGTTGRIAIAGIVGVTQTGTITAGQLVTTSAVAGLAASVAPNAATILGTSAGIWLRSVTGGGPHAALIGKH